MFIRTYLSEYRKPATIELLATAIARRIAVPIDCVSTIELTDPSL